MKANTYIAFLRGINVGGQKKVSMEALRKLCADAGFTNVKTYLQSGNVVFKSKMRDIQKMEDGLSTFIYKEFGFEVPVLVLSTSQLQEILSKNPFKQDIELKANSLYFVLLKSAPENSLMEAFLNEHFENEEFSIENHCVYLACKNGYGKAKLNNNLIEKKLRVLATTRNYRTMNKLLEMVGEI
ncbi:MAG: DUF1697 domain-containing protein [Maribacter sp.]